MKKLLCTLLALIVVLGAMFVFVSCDDEDKDSESKPEATEGQGTPGETDPETDEGTEAGNEPETDEVTDEGNEPETDEVTDAGNDPETDEVTDAGDEPEVEAGIYNNGKISFAYPAAWTNSDDMMYDETYATTNNIVVTYEEMSNIYSTMDVASFNEIFKPAFEAMGMTVTNASVEQLTNGNGVKTTKIAYTATYMGVQMDQTMYVVAAGGFNYIVTITEAEPDAELVENVYNTLTVVK